MYFEGEPSVAPCARCQEPCGPSVVFDGFAEATEDIRVCERCILEFLLGARRAYTRRREAALRERNWRGAWLSALSMDRLLEGR